MYRMVDSRVHNYIRKHLRENEGDRLQVKALKGNKAIDAWRREFCSLKAVELEEELEAIEDLVVSEKQTGTFLTLRKIVVELGNDPEAALNWGRSCLELGPSEYKVCVPTIFELDFGMFNCFAF